MGKSLPISPWLKTAAIAVFKASQVTINSVEKSAYWSILSSEHSMSFNSTKASCDSSVHANFTAFLRSFTKGLDIFAKSLTKCL